MMETDQEEIYREFLRFRICAEGAGHIAGKTERALNVEAKQLLRTMLTEQEPQQAEAEVAEQAAEEEDKEDILYVEDYSTDQGAHDPQSLRALPHYASLVDSLAAKFSED